MLVGTCVVRLWNLALIREVLVRLRLILERCCLTLVANVMLPSPGVIMLTREWFRLAECSRPFPWLMHLAWTSPLTILVSAVGALTLFERDLLLLSVVPRLPLLI